MELKTTLTRIKKLDNEQIQILAKKLGITGVELISVMLKSYKTINNLKGKDVQPITLNCTKEKGEISIHIGGKK